MKLKYLLTTVFAVLFIIACDKEKQAETASSGETEKKEQVQLTGETLFIVAKSGLRLRAEPNVEAEVITLVPYGGGVQVVKNDKDPVPMSSEGLKGHWKKVQYDGKTGYAFDGFMISRPAPRNGESFKEYIYRVYGPKQSEKIHTAKEEVNMQNKKSYKEEYFLKNGAKHVATGYFSGSTDTYHLPETTVQEAFLMAKLTGLAAFFKNMNFPRESKTESDKKEPNNSYRVKVKKSGGRITEIVASRDVYFSVEIKSTADGVKVVSGGGT